MLILPLVLVLGAAPRVESVVVYPDRAQVTRVAEVPCSGRVTVPFEGIPPAADPQSLRASAKGATVEGLRSEEQPLAEAYSKELAALDDDVRTTQRELQALEDADARAANQTALGTQFENTAVALISRDVAVSRPDPKTWSSAFDRAMQARLGAAASQAETAAKRRALTYRMEDLQAKRLRLQAASGRKALRAEVLVRCAGGTARVELTYLVGGASWAPSYEARADEPGAVELSTWATITQQSGEDWRGAKLLLSTAVPSQDATPPELQPLKISAEKHEEEKKVLVRREEQIQHAEEGAAEQEAGGQMPARPQGLSVQLEVAHPGDVPGDGSPVRLFVGRHRLPAKFAWRTAPTLAPFVFRVADVSNATPFPLLPGPLDAFGRSGFVGRTHQERVPQGAPFHLTFGIEDQVKVKRVVLQEIQRDQGLFNQTKRFRYAYRFELENYTGRPVQVEVADRVPVSELDDVAVGIDEATTRGYQLQPQDGVVKWKVKLSPAEKTSVDLAFHVDVPDSYDTRGL